MPKLNHLLKNTKIIFDSYTVIEMKAWLQKEHNKHFIEWFDEQIHSQLKLDNRSFCEKMYWLFWRPASKVFSYASYAINGYTFYMKAQDEKSQMQNNGVTVIGKR